MKGISFGSPAWDQQSLLRWVPFSRLSGHSFDSRRVFSTIFFCSYWFIHILWETVPDETDQAVVNFSAKPQRLLSFLPSMPDNQSTSGTPGLS